MQNCIFISATSKNFKLADNKFKVNTSKEVFCSGIYKQLNCLQINRIVQNAFGLLESNK